MCSSMATDPNAETNWFVKWMLKHPTADKLNAEAELRASGLLHVIVRPTRLMDLPPRGMERMVARESGPMPYLQISRADVATFMVAQSTSETWVNRACNLAWTSKN